MVVRRQICDSDHSSNLEHLRLNSPIGENHCSYSALSLTVHPLSDYLLLTSHPSLYLSILELIHSHSKLPIVKSESHFKDYFEKLGLHSMEPFVWPGLHSVVWSVIPVWYSKVLSEWPGWHSVVWSVKPELYSMVWSEKLGWHSVEPFVWLGLHSVEPFMIPVWYSKVLSEWPGWHSMVWSEKPVWY